MVLAAARKIHRSWAALMAVFMLAAAPAARAELVTIAFTGVVDSSGLPSATSIAVGDTLTAFYTFESTTAPQPGSTSTSAVFNALTHLEFAFSGGYSGASSASQEIQIDNNPALPDVDRYAVVSRTVDGLVAPDADGLPLSTFGLRFDDSTNSVFTDALILPTSLNLASFDSDKRRFLLLFGDIANPTIVSGAITSLSTVPEPSSIALAACCGLAGLGRRWRRRSPRAL